MLASWSADGVTWTPFGRARRRPDRPKVGLAAYNGNGGPPAFDFFRLEEKDRGAVQDRRDARDRLQDAVRRHAGQPRPLEDGRPRRLLAAGRLLDPVLRRARAALPRRSGPTGSSWTGRWPATTTPACCRGFKDPGTDPFNAVNEGHEIQIDATDDPSHTTGAIYNFQAAEAAARDAALKPPGQWNAYELVVDAPKVQVFLNGTKINDYVDRPEPDERADA